MCPPPSAGDGLRPPLPQQLNQQPMKIDSGPPVRSTVSGAKRMKPEEGVAAASWGKTWDSEGGFASIPRFPGPECRGQILCGGGGFGAGGVCRSWMGKVCLLLLRFPDSVTLSVCVIN